MSFIGYFVAISKEARLQPLRACQSMMRIAQSKEREMGGMATPPIRVRITSVKRGNVRKGKEKHAQSASIERYTSPLLENVLELFF